MSQPSDMSMLTTSDASSLQDIIGAWKAQGLTVGFVPTMGALHDGHLSLVRLALKKADRCVVSVFVNPAQFAPHEDFDNYPREQSKDLKKLQDAGTHLVYSPDKAQVYPEGMDTDIKAGKAGQGLDTDFRPHFFDGIVNVVSRLFDQVQPDIAVFGEKDFQQLQVMHEMVETLGLDVEIIGGPLVRDDHGLALSSRNAYLSEGELEIARMLNQIIYKAAHDIREGASVKAATAEATTLLLTTGFDKVDYIEERWGRILAAGWVGNTRLLDNVAI